MYKPKKSNVKKINLFIDKNPSLRSISDKLTKTDKENANKR